MAEAGDYQQPDPEGGDQPARVGPRGFPQYGHGPVESAPASAIELYFGVAAVKSLESMIKTISDANLSSRYNINADLSFAENVTGIIKRALGAYQVMLDEQAAGGTMLIKRKNGKLFILQA